MYKELSVFRSKTQWLPRGEARAAKSPLLGGDRLHHQVHQFLKIKTGPENSVCLVAGAPPTPTAMLKSVHPVPSKYRAIPTNTHL